MGNRQERPENGIPRHQVPFLPLCPSRRHITSPTEQAHDAWCSRSFQAASADSRPYVYTQTTNFQSSVLPTLSSSLCGLYRSGIWIVRLCWVWIIMEPSTSQLGLPNRLVSHHDQSAHVPPDKQKKTYVSWCVWFGARFRLQVAIMHAHSVKIDAFRLNLLTITISHL
jgi:hypothetical protein